MITHPLTILACALVIVTALSQPLFAAEEGSKTARTAVYPGFYGVGPFSYRGRMEMERMQALRARSEAIREARKREGEAVKEWQEDRERWLDPRAEAMRDWMEKRDELLRQNQQAWWRWRDPRGAYMRDRNAAQRGYWDEMAKQRKKALEQYQPAMPWGAYPY